MGSVSELDVLVDFEMSVKTFERALPLNSNFILVINNFISKRNETPLLLEPRYFDSN